MTPPWMSFFVNVSNSHRLVRSLNGTNTPDVIRPYDRFLRRNKQALSSEGRQIRFLDPAVSIAYLKATTEQILKMRNSRPFRVKLLL